MTNQHLSIHNILRSKKRHKTQPKTQITGRKKEKDGTFGRQRRSGCRGRGLGRQVLIGGGRLEDGVGWVGEDDRKREAFDVHSKPVVCYLEQFYRNKSSICPNLHE